MSRTSMPDAQPASGGARQLRNSVIYLIPAVVTAVSVFFTLPIFTRILTVDDYGALALATAYGTFASSVANFGLVVSFQRNFFQFESLHDRSALLHSIVAFVCAMHTLLAGGTWAFRHAISDLITRTPDYGLLIFWAFCAAGMASIKAYYLTYFRNTHDAGAYVRYSIDETVLGLMLSLILVVYVRIGVLGLVLGQLGASALVLILLMVRFTRVLPPAFSWRLLRESLTLSYPLTPKLLMGEIGNQFDKYMIALLGSVGAVGLYSIAQKFAFPIFTFINALGNVFVPSVYERMFARRAGDEDTVGPYLTPYLYVCIGAALCVALFAEEVVRLLTPEAYHGAAVLVPILALYYATMFFGKQPQLMFAKKTFLISVASIFTIVVHVTCVTIGITYWGAAGAAWGTFASGLTAAALAQILGHRFYAISWQYGPAVAIVGLFVASALLAIVMTSTGVDHRLALGVKGILAVAYFVLGVRLSVITRHTLTLANQALPAFLRRRAV